MLSVIVQIRHGGDSALIAVEQGRYQVQLATGVPNPGKSHVTADAVTRAGREEKLCQLLKPLLWNAALPLL